MNRHLARAVIASFRATDAAVLHDGLAQYDLREWRGNLHWLDASGLALYFLQRIKALQIQNALPPAILIELEQRMADNKRSTASLLYEFARINARLQEVGLQYVNLKGFTLVPDYCPDLSLRYQMDCDLLVREADEEHCSQLLNGLGYALVASHDGVLEFKSNSSRVPHIRDLYKPKRQRSVEVHLLGLATAGKFGLDASAMETPRLVTVNGLSFPALANSRMFVAQAAHVFRHMRSEWTRVSWLLEFSNFVAANHTNRAFWDETQSAAERVPDAEIAISATLALCQRAFGTVTPEPLAAWMADKIQVNIQFWIERYADEILLADHPGTKLYLLLEKELGRRSDVSRLVRQRVFPVHAPARISSTAGEKLSQRLIARWFEYRYFLFRLRFHLTETPRYLLESWRWKRLSSRRVATELRQGSGSAPTLRTEPEFPNPRRRPAIAKQAKVVPR